MTRTIALPDDYGYVLLAATASTFISVVHTTITSNHRRVSQVPYPNAYVSAAEAAASPAKARFNCAQRAHANFTENHATFLVNLLVAGLGFPKTSAVLGATWIVGKLVYTFGYVREGKEDGTGRLVGTWWWLPHLALMGMAVAAEVKML